MTIAALIDVTRISVYLSGGTWGHVQENVPIVAAATGAAFLGAFVGNRLLKKVTLHAIQVAVAVMLIVVALGLGAGLL